MARAIWKGSLGFGLVNIPVELFTAVRDSRPRFRLLHRKDESPVHYQRVCERDGKPVTWEDLVNVEDFSLPSDALVRDKELTLAMSLVEGLSGDWHPEKYKDEYRENLMRIIQAKLKGKTPKLGYTDATPGQADVIDLMERLRQSLGMAKARAKAAGRQAAKNPPAKKRTRQTRTTAAKAPARKARRRAA